tara:strand:+ start:16781 stop:19591 length:2811 start_codon:yes stop_codon:yes gene_type:complete
MSTNETPNEAFYTATATAEEPPKEPAPYEISLGTSGTAFWNGDIEDEYNPDLTPKKWRGIGGDHGIVSRMRREDSVIAAVERAMKLPILSATWQIEPGKEGDPERNREIAEFIHEALFVHNRDSWRGFLEQALDYLTFGFMLFERIYKLIDDPKDKYHGHITLSHLAPRMPWTVDRWIVSNDYSERLSGIIQVDQAGTPINRMIPAWKLVRLTYQQAGQNFEGRSSLRAAYRPYFIRRKAWKLWGIGLERWAVPTPIATIRETSYSSFKTQISKALQSLRTNDKGRIVLPDSVKLDSYSPKSGMDPSSFLKETAYEIVMSTLTNFLMTGRETGTQSLGKEQASFLSQSLSAITDQISEVLSDGTDGYPGVIKQLVDFNFPNVRDYPKLVCSSVGEKDAIELIASLNTAIQSGLIQPTRDDEIHIRNKLKLPAAPEEEEEVTIKPEPVLDGTQIVAAKQIINEAYMGMITKEAARAMLVYLMGLDDSSVDLMLAGVSSYSGFESEDLPSQGFPYPSEHAARQLDPGLFKSFRRIHPKDFPKGVDMVLGIKEDGSTATQSFRFKVEDGWTAEKVKSWLKENGHKSQIEEATKKKESLENGCNHCGSDKCNHFDSSKTGAPTSLESSKYWRPLTAFEKFVSFEKIEKKQNNVGSKVAALMETAQSEMIEEFIKSVKPLIEKKDIEAIMEFRPDGAKELASKLEGPLKESLSAGYASVGEEMVRQLKDLPIDKDEDRPIHFQIENEDLTNKKKEIDALPGAYLSGVSSVTVDFDQLEPTDGMDPLQIIGGAAIQASNWVEQRVVNTGVNSALLQAQSGVFNEENLKETLDNLSVKQLRSRGNAAGILSFSSGRALAGDTASENDAVRTAFYSAILDSNTCDPCREMDRLYGEPGDPHSPNSTGLTFDQTQEFKPPLSACKGKDLCRCMIIYIFDSERIRT